jgi:hypothetical protein
MIRFLGFGVWMCVLDTEGRELVGDLKVHYNEWGSGGQTCNEDKD